MTCCVTTIIPFVNQATSVVPYMGNKPTVSMYYNIEGVWQAAGVATAITYGAASVTIDHGGNATGVVKLIQ